MGFVGVFTGQKDNPFLANSFRDKTEIINFAEEYADVIERLAKRRDQFESVIAAE